jgi:hypothetical protein
VESADEGDVVPADAITFATHLGDGPDDPAARTAHLHRCAACARVARALRADPAVGPDLELRLLRAFRDRPGP